MPAIILLIIIGLAMAGCSGMHYEAYPQGPNRYLVLRELIIQHWFAPDVQISWLEHCKREVTVPYTWEEGRWHWDRDYIDYQDCHRVTPYRPLINEP